jgi:hypothetical protein
MASSSTGPCRRVFALDFDGVICNSVGESSQSAYRYLQKNEPQILVGTGWENQCPPWLIHKMRKLRPVVETGYENILLARLLIEEQKLDLDEFKSEQGTRPLQAGELISNWGPDLRDTVQLRYGYTKEQLVSAFGKERDDWMRDDMASWLNANTFYEGVPDAVKSCMGDAYIITTKQQRFACALLEHAGLGKEFPPEKVSTMHVPFSANGFPCDHKYPFRFLDWGRAPKLMCWILWPANCRRAGSCTFSRTESRLYKVGGASLPPCPQYY